MYRNGQQWQKTARLSVVFPRLSARDDIPQLCQQLGDIEVRHKLLNLLPSLVDDLDIDLEHKCYRVLNHAGEISAWRQLAR